MKRGTPDHPKMLDLADELLAYLPGLGLNIDLEFAQTIAVGIIERLWHATGRYSPRGDIGKFSNARIATCAGWKYDADWLAQTLLKIGWFDASDECRLYVHDWHQHCEDAVDKYLAENGLTYANGSGSRRTPQKTLRGSRPSREKSGQPEPRPRPKPRPAPSPSPSGPAAPKPDDDGGGGVGTLPDDWTPIVRRLAKLGMTAAANCCRQATARGLVPGECGPIVDHWERENLWGVNALHYRLANGHPGIPADEGWMEPDPAKLKARRSSQAAEKARLAHHDDKVRDQIREWQREKFTPAQIEARLAEKGWRWPE